MFSDVSESESESEEQYLPILINNIVQGAEENSEIGNLVFFVLYIIIYVKILVTVFHFATNSVF